MFRIAVGLYMGWVVALSLSVGCHAMNRSRATSYPPQPAKIEPSPVVARGNGSEKIDRDLQQVSAMLQPAAQRQLHQVEPATIVNERLESAVEPNMEPSEDQGGEPPAPVDRPERLVGSVASGGLPPLDPARGTPADPPKLTAAEPISPAAEQSDSARAAPLEPQGSQAPSSFAMVSQILERAEEFNRRVPDFVCRMTRSERIQGSIRSPELMLMKLRGRPRSVHLKWLDSANEGRECIYISGQNNGKMISRGGKGDLILSGRILWLDPESGLAKSKSSQTINETGLDVTCGKIRRRLDRLLQRDESLGTLSASTGPDPYVPELSYDWIEHQGPAGVDGDLPRGGTHRYGFRQDNGQLEVVHAFDRRNELIYTYRFERLIPVSHWEPNDFNVEILAGKKNKGEQSADRVVRVEDAPPH